MGGSPTVTQRRKSTGPRAEGGLVYSCSGEVPTGAVALVGVVGCQEILKIELIFVSCWHEGCEAKKEGAKVILSINKIPD